MKTWPLEPEPLGLELRDSLHTVCVIEGTYFISTYGNVYETGLKYLTHQWECCREVGLEEKDFVIVFVQEKRSTVLVSCKAPCTCYLSPWLVMGLLPTSNEGQLWGNIFNKWQVKNFVLHFMQL